MNGRVFQDAVALLPSRKATATADFHVLTVTHRQLESLGRLVSLSRERRLSLADQTLLAGEAQAYPYGPMMVGADSTVRVCPALTVLLVLFLFVHQPLRIFRILAQTEHRDQI